MIIEGVLSERGARLVAVRMEQPLSRALARMQTEAVDVVIVTDHCATEGMAVLGICSQRDAEEAIGKHGPKTLEMPVGAFAVGRLVVCDATDRVSDVLAELERRSIEHVLVMDREQAFGVLNVSDLRPHARPLADPNRLKRAARSLRNAA